MPSDWAGFFDQASYEAFMRTVIAHLETRRWEYDVQPDHIRANEAQYGLLNLAQSCAQHEGSEWPALVAEHFDRIEASAVARDALDEEWKNFANASPHLAVRLWHPESVPAETLNTIVHRTDIEGTLSVLVLDMPDIVATVLRSQVKNWQRSEDELFEIALANLKQKSPAPLERFEIEPGLELLFISDGSFLVSGHALCFDDHAEWVGAHGALVGFPARDVILAFPINDASCIKVISPMIRVIGNLFNEGPSSISPSLYWFHDEQFTALPHEVEGDTIEFHPPAAFAEMMNALVEKKPG